VSESRVTWATSVPILVFLGLSVLDLGPIYATDRRQTLQLHLCSSLALDSTTEILTSLTTSGDILT